MLTDNVKSEIRSAVSNLSKVLPGYRTRASQLTMIAEVAKTLARCPDVGSNTEKPSPGETSVAIQASTGTGKSVAYGLVGMIMAQHKRKALIISSSTIALQEQLVLRDLPIFARAAGLNLKIELAKGRTRYVCHYKLSQATDDLEQVALFGSDVGDETTPQRDEARLVLLSMAKDYAEDRWNGNRDTIDVVSDVLWRSVTTDRHGCLGRKCPAYSSCAQAAARKRLQSADVVVTNHDLLLADLGMGGGVILPSPQNAFYVIDECHSLPDKAVGSFAASHLVGADRKACDKIISIAPSIASALGSSWDARAVSIADDAADLGEVLAEAHRFFSGLSQLVVSATVPRPTLEFVEGSIPEEFAEVGNKIHVLANRIDQGLAECLEAANESIGSETAKRPMLEKLMSDLGFLAGRIEGISNTWSLFLEETAEGQAPVAKWVESVTIKSGTDYSINASPVVAGGYLRELLWEKAAGVILTSATMTTLGTFGNFMQRSGLHAYKDIQCLDLPSPFDFESQGTLEIPKCPSPKNYEAHTQSIADLLIDEFKTQGAEGKLVLFTSRRQMEDVASRIPDAAKARILIQGTQSKNATIAAHKTRIEGGNPSVIFGLESYTEGVDLAGHLCNHVVCVKLPFAVPDSPVLRTLSAWISARGGDPFMEISVPAAARKLEQAVGRLIRTESDTGRVTVLDPRLWQSQYGRSILRGLPPFKLIAMGKEAKL